MKDFYMDVSGLDPSLKRKIEAKAFSLGLQWCGTGAKPWGSLDITNTISILRNSGGSYILSAGLYVNTVKISYKDFIAGKYDSQISPTPKKVRDVKIDLSWLRRKAREVVSEAIQKKAFEKGFVWAGDSTPRVQSLSMPYLFLKSKTITQSRDGDWFSQSPCKEVSVNNALEGVYEKSYSDPSFGKQVFSGTRASYKTPEERDTVVQNAVIQWQVTPNAVNALAELFLSMLPFPVPYEGYKLKSIWKRMEEIESKSKKTLNTGDSVLVRDFDQQVWKQATLYETSDKDIFTFPYFCRGASGLVGWKQCIPYEGNEKYLRTNLKPM